MHLLYLQRHDQAPILGQSTWTVEFTINDTDATPTGNGGYCFPSEGELTIFSDKGDIKAQVSGPASENFLSISSSTNVWQYGQAFQIDPTPSDGAALGLNGGSFSLSAEFSNSRGFTAMRAVGLFAK